MGDAPYWLCYRHANSISVASFMPGASLIHARMRASIDGLGLGVLPQTWYKVAMAAGAYILISLVLLYAGVHLFVGVFRKLKEPLFKMFLGAISIFMIVCAVAVFFVGIQHIPS